MPDQFRPLKDAFARYATGVAVATCLDSDGNPVAITINSFTSVSLDPALVLWCVEYRASSFPIFMGATSYGVSVLRADGQALSRRFASREPKPLTPEEIDVWETGAPILKDRLAGFDCNVVAPHKAGDHCKHGGGGVRLD
ncbi:MAG: flavin reductase family protein, partial [Parvularculaceae bacterium]